MEVKVTYQFIGIIAENGIPIIDNMYLEALAKLLGDKHEFVLIVLPLRLSGATASPLNPIALLLSLIHI